MSRCFVAEVGIDALVVEQSLLGAGQGIEDELPAPERVEGDRAYRDFHEALPPTDSETRLLALARSVSRLRTSPPGIPASPFARRPMDEVDRTHRVLEPEAKALTLPLPASPPPSPSPRPDTVWSTRSSLGTSPFSGRRTRRAAAPRVGKALGGAAIAAERTVAALRTLHSQ